MKRVGLHERFDPGQHFVAGRAQRQQLRGQFGQHDAGGAGAGDHHGLLAEAVNTSVSRSLPPVARVAQQLGHDGPRPAVCNASGVG